MRKARQLPNTAPEQVDVIVVGSGASGGWAPKHLCEAGVKVALLDAGRAQERRTGAPIVLTDLTRLDLTLPPGPR